MQSQVGYRQQAIDFWTSLEISKKIENGIPHGYNIPVLMVQGNCYQSKLKTLNECNCCDRHGTNRPKNLGLWIECESNSFMKYDNTVQCECNCRHLARVICRDPSVCDECSDQSDVIKEKTQKNPMCAVFSLFLSVFSCYLTIDFFPVQKKN